MQKPDLCFQQFPDSQGKLPVRWNSLGNISKVRLFAPINVSFKRDQVLQGLKQHALSGAVRSDDGEAVSRIYLETQVAKHHTVAESNLEIPN
jgi:hypothetical protein